MGTGAGAPSLLLGAPLVSADVLVLASPPPASSVAARVVVDSGGGAALLLLPAPPTLLELAAVAAAHAVHFLEAAGFFRWLLEKQPGGWFLSQAAHSMLLVCGGGSITKKGLHVEPLRCCGMCRVTPRRGRS